MLRAVTIFVIAGTFLIGAYYVVSSSYVQPVQQDSLALGLNSFQHGLTYDEFVTFDESQRSFLVQQMPSSLTVMLQQEAGNHPSFISENADKIREQSGSDEIRVLDLTQVFGLKGYKSQGEAAVIVSGNMVFLRLQDFGVTSGIDQHLYLTKDGTASTGIDLGRLKASQGEQYYDITGVDTKIYNNMIIYDKTFDTYYAYAKFLVTS